MDGPHAKNKDSFLFIRSADDQIVNSQIQTEEVRDINLEGNEDGFSCKVHRLSS